MSLSFSSCFEPPKDTTNDSTDTSTASDLATENGVLFYEHVAPIFAEKCWGCHNTNLPIAPFPMITYEDTVAWAGAIKTAVNTRAMPPWAADDVTDPNCQPIRGSLWLNDMELMTINAWVDQGAKRGNPALSPPPPSGSSVLQKTSIVLDMGESYTPPSTMTDMYRCFVINQTLQTEQFLKAILVMPGNRAIAHHLQVFVANTQTDIDNARDKDAADPGPGYTCFGGPTARDPTKPVNTKLVALWAPGNDLVEFPDNMGLRIPAGRNFIFQMHYSVNMTSQQNDPQNDRTKIALHLEDAVQSELAIEFNINQKPGFVIPPGQALVSTPVEAGYGIYSHLSLFGNTSTGRTEIWGAFPHMHKVGTRIEANMVKRRPQGGYDSPKCLIDTPKYDFNWQRFYVFQQPFVMESGDIFTYRCDYKTDHLPPNGPDITWGEGSEEEMCSIPFYYKVQ